MTRVRGIPLLAAVTVAACSDANGPAGSSIPVAVTWLAWPAAVTAAQPGSIRVVGFHGGCGSFRLEVAQSGPSNVSVSAEQHFDTDSPQFCPEAAIIFDSLLPLPPLVSPTGSTGAFTVDAPIFDPLGGMVRRGFGYLVLSDQQPDAMLQVGGRAVVRADSLGCSWAEAALPGIAGPYVLSSNLTLGTNERRSAFISGSFTPALSPRCGQNLLLQLRVAEVQVQ
jgi:hypothetical protein